MTGGTFDTVDGLCDGQNDTLPVNVRFVTMMVAESLGVNGSQPCSSGNILALLYPLFRSRLPARVLFFCTGSDHVVPTPLNMFNYVLYSASTKYVVGKLLLNPKKQLGL